MRSEVIYGRPTIPPNSISWKDKIVKKKKVRVRYEGKDALLFKAYDRASKGLDVEISWDAFIKELKQLISKEKAQ